jgi:hypothetical protein
MKRLPIVWQRLVSNGETCDRCGATQGELRRALAKLELALRPLGIEPTLEMRAIDEATFRAGPLDSNRVWIGGRPLEEWLGAATGSSPCCAACGDADCRTVELGGQVFETIPEDLIVRAALLAAAAIDASPSAIPACCAPTPLDRRQAE